MEHGTRLRAGAAALVALMTLGCAKGRTPPESTTMVPVTTRLAFFVGDLVPCTAYGQAPYVCGTECAPGSTAGCVPVSGLGPPIQVEVEPFCIDEHEVTNLQYQFCEEMGACPRRPFDNLGNRIDDYGKNSQYDDYPANVINFDAAEAYCRFVGKRLPTAFEWERVSGGGAQEPDLSDQRLYPFLEPGQTDPTLCAGTSVAINVCRNQSQGVTLAVKAASDDVVLVDGEGSGRVYDLAGNFREWTSTPYSSTLGLLQQGLTCAADSRANCNPQLVFSAPDCGPGESPSNAQCCDCGGEPCARLCEGSGVELAICAPRFAGAGPVSQDDPGWAPAPGTFVDAHIVKGGAYDTSPTGFCQARTSAWAFQDDVQQTQLSLGIRCAADLGTPACPAP